MNARVVSERFAENLVRARNRSDFSQEELGLRAELHRTEISLLERGTRVPQIDTLIKLASALSVSPAELLDGLAWNRGEFPVGNFISFPSEQQQKLRRTR